MARCNLGLLGRKSEMTRTPPTEPATSREQNAGFFSKLTFAWLNPLMKTGYKRRLDQNDIWPVHEARTAELLHARLREAFHGRVRHGSRHPLPLALYDAFRSDFLLGACFELITAVLEVMAPFVIRYLISYAQDAYDAMSTGREPPAIGVGIGYAVGIAMMLVLQSLALSHFYYRGSLMGGKSRSALVAMAFAKSLRLSKRAKAGGRPDLEATAVGSPITWDHEGWPESRVMSLIGTDAGRIHQALEVFHYVWISPLQIALTVALLIVNLGYSAVPGVALLILALVLVAKCAKYYTRSRATINASTDRRVALTQEMLQAVRFVKMLSWQDIFLKRLEPLRARETRDSRWLHFLKSGIEAFSMAIPIFSTLVAVVTYAGTGHALTPANVFSSLALINGLRTPTSWFPLAVGMVSDAMMAVKRFESFLLAEEHNPTKPSEDLKSAVELDCASFTWERANTASSPSYTSGKKSRSPYKAHQNHNSAETENNITDKSTSPAESVEQPFDFHGISLSLGRQELIGVVGAVGSGKSSLLSALAGDMRQVRGSLRVCDTRAFCPQQAWIQNCSIRQNICFGKPYDAQRYASVVQACALLADFQALPHGDRTEIGERGLTLSGGQKQRINIARAIYSGAQIVILDDPLSAVDAQVGTHIFNQAICGLLRSQCCIMATNQLHILPRCDRVVWMDEGICQGIGRYEKMLSQFPRFAKLVAAGAELSNQDQSDVSRERGDISHADIPHAPREKLEEPTLLMQEDVLTSDPAPWSVYIVWARSSGNLAQSIGMVALHAIFRGANILTSQWLSWWVSHRFPLSRGAYIGIYAALAVSQGMLLFITFAVTCVVGTRGAQSISNKAMGQILRAPIAFFDTTPLGRIMHRFTTDVDIMDNQLTDSIKEFLLLLTSLLGAAVLIVVYFYYFAIAIVVCTLAVVVTVSYYRRSARDLKRHHTILDAVVFARFSEALMGTSCIRAYGREQHFVKELHKAMDAMNSASFLTFANSRWLSIRLDNISNLLTFTTAVLVATNTFSVPPSISGLVLSYGLSMAGLLQIMIKYFTMVDNGMTSTERLHQYATDTAQEAPLYRGDVSLSHSWPEKGAICYENVQMRYRPGLPLAVDGFSLNIKGGERVGIVGRTGAGKSTILSSIFRLTELCGGKISIDGVDISQIGLHDLRSRLAVVPQDPTLFRGTVRSNLDPEETHTDLALWDALRQAHVNSPLSDEKGGGSFRSKIQLDDAVEEDGANFSLGQRQLLALARVLLRDSRIVLVDEGTSSVDAQTDALIQRTLANGLQGKTLIAIAHRLRTVLLYDRVCVMDHGRIAELGPPKRLWESGGAFRAMCDSNGITDESFRSAWE